LAPYLEDKSPEILSADLSVLDIFTQMDHALLILGAPGSGKTTLLLELARDTIGRAERQPGQPLPVIFNLASWPDKRISLVDWLVEELNTKYQIPKKIGRDWLENNDLLLLLDGLDEVQHDLRDDCVQAINQFRLSYGLTQLTVTCRTKEYEALSSSLQVEGTLRLTPQSRDILEKAQLQLQGSIRLIPLTSDQIDAYLDAAGPNLAVLRDVLKNDPALQEIAQSPLMLSLMSIAYQDKTAEPLSGPSTHIQPISTGASTGEHLKNLLEMYVSQAFQRRKQQTYSPAETKHWLKWLSQQMIQHNLSLFLVEEMQPGWLTKKATQWIYLLVTRIIAGLILGLGLLGLSQGLFAASFGIGASLLFAFLPGLVAGLVTGLIDGLFPKIFFNPKVLLPNNLLWTLIKGVIIIIIAGLSASTLFGIGAFSGSTLSILVRMILVGVPFGLLFGFRVGHDLHDDIQPVEALRWSWFLAGKGLLAGILGGLIITAVLAPFLGSGLFLRLRGVRISLTILSLATLLIPILALIGGTMGGLQGKDLPTQIVPNQGIRQSAKNSLVAGSYYLLLSLLAGFVIVLFALAQGVDLGIAFGALFAFVLVMGPYIVLTAVLWYGGLAWIQHHILRFLLRFQGSVPADYTDFLDFAANLAMLQKVGGAYSFPFRYLRDYFASVDVSVLAKR